MQETGEFPVYAVGLSQHPEGSYTLKCSLSCALCWLLQLQEDKDFDYWKVDFHSIYWRSISHGMTIERVPVRLPGTWAN